MNFNQQNFLHQLWNMLKEREPLPARKNPVIAFLLGFLFGPFGSGWYMGTWKDFGVAFLMLVVFMIVFPGVGVLAGWIFSGVYAAIRVHFSNQKLA